MRLRDRLHDCEAEIARLTRDNAQLRQDLLDLADFGAQVCLILAGWPAEAFRRDPPSSRDRQEVSGVHPYD